MQPNAQSLQGKEEEGKEEEGKTEEGKTEDKNKKRLALSNGSALVLQRSGLLSCCLAAQRPSAGA
ncbi:MAG: hypothetical protein WCP35_15430 [Verrucomicrobiota bacterium]